MSTIKGYFADDDGVESVEFREIGTAVMGSVGGVEQVARLYVSKAPTVGKEWLADASAEPEKP